MKPFITIILKYSLILFILLLAEFWLFSHGYINIPEYIPHTPIKTGGIIICGIYLPTMIIALKSVLKTEPQIELLKLFFISFIISSVPDMLVQLIKANTYDYDFFIFIKEFWITSLGFTAYDFLIAFQLKTKRTGILIALMFVLGILIKVIEYLFPTLLNS